MAAKETLTEAGTSKPAPRRAPSKRAATQDNKPARAKKSTAGRAVKATLPAFTHEMIAERAYHISLSESRGTDEENWHRAEAELRQSS